MKLNTKLFFLFLVLVSADQIIKSISSFLVCNKNIAWNIPIAPAIFYFIWIAIIAFLISIFFRAKSPNQKIFLIFIFSGAISNILDRVRLGCVVDYIDLKFWPVFNLADVYIAVGTILIALAITRNKNTRY
ncbi:MAG: signal peptidase II [Candidatus Moraniibacteriota bacterium]